MQHAKQEQLANFQPFLKTSVLSSLACVAYQESYKNTNNQYIQTVLSILQM